MNDSARIAGRARRVWLATARTAATVIATAIVPLLVAACGSGSGPSSAGSGGTPNARGSTASPSAVAYSYCMRSHGVPRFPDPPSNGGLAKGSAQELGVTGSQFQAAQRACQHLIPATGGSAQQQEQQCFVAHDCSPAVVHRLLTVMLRFAVCMRSHEVPKFPDPTTDSQGQPFFDVGAQGISDRASHSPQFTNKLNECQRRTGNFPFSMG